MRNGHFVRSLPGHLATVLALAATTLVAFLGAGTIFYERWGQPLPSLLVPLLPAGVCLALCLAALRWPRAGGLLLIAAGAGFGGWWLSMQAGKDTTLFQLTFSLLVMFSPIVVTGCLFLLEARHRRRLHDEGAAPATGWLARNHRYLLVAGVPVLALAALSAAKLPQLLSRLDDGLRGSRVIEGNGVTLVWAPQGPGWNATAVDGHYPSWNMLALYGASPVGLETKGEGARTDASASEMARTGLCAFLDGAGIALMAEPANLWRMPTADEIVRSLTRDGVNAGCAWVDSSPHAECRTPPDKETPLWAPDERPIYYLAADEYDSERARCVNYTGGVNRQPKAETGTAGFRCVKDRVPAARPDPGP
jgi:hypothetical protein